MTPPRTTAEQWLDRVYGGAVEPTRYALLETARVAVFGCRFRDETRPMLAGALAVPVNGDAPFPLPNDRPFADLGVGEDDPGDWRAPAERDWRWRLNARNCVVTVDAVVDRSPASALPWQPDDERPGWWDRLRGNHFPDAETSDCADWDEVLAAVRAGGPDTRGVVWVRRQLAGVEITGHLLYAHHTGTDVAVLDGLRGGPADLETATVGRLVLARFHRTRPDADPDLGSAVRRAEAWLADAYGDQVALVDPSPADELDRGWLFACATRAYLASGDFRDQLLDAALVVPKNPHHEPFGLPNADPWRWLERWDAGDPGLPPTPHPGPAAWFTPTLSRLGEVTGTSTHTRWSEVFDEFTTRPTGSTALVWIRRLDRRGRETVGLVINAQRVEGGLQLADGTRPTPLQLTDEGVLNLHVIHYR
ncbi:YrhB domain-containing protein [Actinosynnema sp. CS-041913]|uniref:YrhB domain-containing protein n=1 Tax=Actinosynnema sp. CS-041913 TaxID=3239917 RepID=UPI003D8BDDD7